MNKGFLMLARRTFTSSLWTESRSFSKFEAWLDLLQLAAFLPTKRIIRCHFIEIGRGEVVASLRYLATRWNWKKDKVASFLGLLEFDQMIRRETRQGETIVIVCNYERYNQNGDTKPDTKSDGSPTAARQQPDKVEEGKEREEGIIVSNQKPAAQKAMISKPDPKKNPSKDTSKEPIPFPDNWDSTQPPRHYPTLDQAIEFGKTLNISADVAKFWWETRESAGWTKSQAGGGAARKITNWQADMSLSQSWAGKGAAERRQSAESSTSSASVTIGGRSYRAAK